MEHFIETCIIIMIEIMSAHLFLGTFMTERKYKIAKIHWIWIVLTTFIMYMITQMFHDNVFVKECVIFIVLIFFTRLCFTGKWGKSTILSGAYIGILIAVDMVEYIVITYMLPIDMEQVFNSSLLTTLLTLLCKTVIIVLVVWLRMKYQNLIYTDLLNQAQWLRFLYFPVLTMMVIITIIMKTEALESEENQQVFLMVAIGLVVMNLFIFYFMRDMAEQEAQIRERTLAQERMQNEIALYESLSSQYELQKKNAHEYKNHIGCIQGLLSQKEYDKALNYVQSLAQTIHKQYDTINTNNSYVNAILNTKYAEMIEKHIVFIFRVNDLSQLPMKNEDVVVILSNLLNNAIEACEKVNDKRRIQLKFLKQEDEIILSVKNSTKKKAIQQGEGFQTTKEDAKQHGIGVLTVHELVNKYHGEISIENESTYFYVSITIPNLIA